MAVPGVQNFGNPGNMSGMDNAAMEGKFQDALNKFLDKNGDGKISVEEMKEFEKTHGNGDGLLTKDELKEGLMAEAKDAGMMAGGSEAGKGGGSEAGKGGGSEAGGAGGSEAAGGAGEEAGASGGLPEEMMKLIDKDGDGKISPEEMKEFEAKHGNGDGLLTKDELKEGLMAEAKEQGMDLNEAEVDQALDQLDANKDEIISADEFSQGQLTEADIDQALGQLDASADEIISADELNQNAAA